jgi:hypothetical protein
MARTGLRRGHTEVRRYRGSIVGILTVQTLLTLGGMSAIVVAGGVAGHVEVALLASALFFLGLVISAARVSIEISGDGAVVQNRFRRHLVPADAAVVLRRYWLSVNGFPIAYFRVDGRLIPIIADASPWGRRTERLRDDLLRTYRHSHA